MPAITNTGRWTQICGRRFPAEFIGQSNVELALAQIDWLYSRSKIGRLQLAVREKELKSQIEKLFAQRASLVESLPLEFRFADDRARSEAVSRCLQELLAVRLDLATQHALSTEQARQPEEIQNLKHQVDLQTHELLIKQKKLPCNRLNCPWLIPPNCKKKDLSRRNKYEVMNLVWKTPALNWNRQN